MNFVYLYDNRTMKYVEIVSNKGGNERK
jgi:hypothetical protein